MFQDKDIAGTFVTQALLKVIGLLTSEKYTLSR